ncbi:MAG TPA: DUF1579 domain-containing protein [Gemmataceae bacterium]|jgi:hypothetical protein|nr:DUF1579 domain-containing protein [Gemmataceae bacterium]
MRAKVLTLVCCFVLGTFVASLAAQPPTAKPGPEHEMLKEKFEGDWDASMDFGGNKSKGTARYKMGLGGFWLLMDFTGDFGGAKFEGKGATGYDPVKKKYVGTWIDTMTPHLMLSEGTFDKEGKTYTDTGEVTGADGKAQKSKSVYEFKDKDTIIFTMYMTMDGKEQKAFEITYTRKK